MDYRLRSQQLDKATSAMKCMEYAKIQRKKHSS